MKSLFTLALFFIAITTFAQKPCEYSVNVQDTLGIYKETPEYIISEKKFGDNSNYVLFALAQTDGLPSLNVHLIQKSKGFIKANCLDKNSKIFLQLQNGKIVTLIHTNQENCGTLIRDEQGYDNRFTAGIFMFLKENYEDLKTSPVTLMRIKYLTDTEDYIIKRELVSEMDGKTYNPESYFMNYIRCIED
jgi:hypothetical protein